MRRDSRTRSLAKAVGWRAIGIVVLGVLAYALTGDLVETGWIALGFHTVMVVLYFFYERAWERVRWGRTERG